MSFSLRLEAIRNESGRPRCRRKTTKQVQYGKAKPSYKTQDGTNNTIVRFNGTDASTDSVFLLKFLEKIKQHNLKDYNDH